MLLAAGADPNYQVETMVPYLTLAQLSEIGRELWAAAGQGKAGSVKMLLAAGADPNYQVETLVL
jgi:hypothetical protein